MKTPPIRAGYRAALLLCATSFLLSLSACATRMQWTPQPDPTALSWNAEPGFNSWTGDWKSANASMPSSPLPLPERLVMPDGKHLLPMWAVAQAGGAMKATANTAAYTANRVWRMTPFGGDTSKGVGYCQRGMASWYGPDFAGKPTANGEIYDPSSFTAAHKSLPFNSVVQVKNLETGKSIPVRINNRGPFKDGRIIDLSVAAAKALGTYNEGLAQVEITRVQ